MLAALKDGSLPPAEFGHANHVRAGWLLLREYPLPEATDEFCTLLKAYVGRIGAEGKFHVTLTRALLHLIHQRMAGNSSDWAAFQTGNRDLFDDAKALLGRHYSLARLDSAEARQRFVEPDREPLPAAAQGAAKR